MSKTCYKGEYVPALHEFPAAWAAAAIGPTVYPAPLYEPNMTSPFDASGPGRRGGESEAVGDGVSDLNEGDRVSSALSIMQQAINF